MKELSIVQSELLDQYFRCRNAIRDYENEIKKYPKGYISYKQINGKQYAYLQHKENGKIVSKYIKNKELQDIERKISNRKKYEKSCKELKRSMKDIEKFLGRKVINEYDN